MPKENRSSNTENLPCPFCAGRVDPGGWLRGDGTRGPECESCGATAPTLSVWNSANPTTQPHPDPIAWMVGTAFWWTKEEAERDAAETGLPIVGLGPMTDTAEVERLRGEVRRLHDAGEFLDNVSQGIEDKLRAQLAEAQALLRTFAENSDDDDVVELSNQYLSASAEPKCGKCHGRGLLRIATVCGPADKNCPDCASAEPSAPAVSNLPELTDDLREILGRPNFTCHFIAKALRVMGHSIAPKSEDEQAVVIHWLLGHYLKNGSDWRLRAEAELKSASEKLAPSAAPQK